MATVLAACTIRFLAYAQRRGLDRVALMAEAGLTERALEDPNGRIAIEHEIALWRGVDRRLDDEALGLDFARGRAHERPRGVVGVLTQASATIEDGLRAAATYHRLLVDDGVATFSVDGDGGVLRWAPSCESARAPSPPHMEDAFLAGCIVFAGAWTGHDLAPEWVRCRRSRPQDTRPFETMFACPIAFGASVTEIAFSADVLALPLRHRQAEVAPYLALAADAFAERLGSTRSLREEMLTVLEAVGTEQGEVAKHFGWSVRTLQRRLLEEGIRYDRLVDDHRRRTASVLFGDASLTFVQVAHKVGFSDTRAFRRAIHRWQREEPESREQERGDAPSRR